MIDSRFLGSDGCRYARFEAISDHPLTHEELYAVQKKHGYHPDGYGNAHKVSEEKREDGKYVTVLSCWGTCE